MNEPTTSTQLVAIGLAQDDEGLDKRGLVERMYEARNNFKKDHAEYAQFSHGYKLRLYAHFQFVYGMDEDFRGDGDELLRMTNQDYFNCNRQRPDENNLLRHLLYFLVDARTEKEREKWLRPAAVLEHFRKQEISVPEVAQRLREGGGFTRIYKSFSGGRAAVRDSYDDLELLRQDPEQPDDQSSGSDPADGASGAPYLTYSKPDEAAQPGPASRADGEDEIPEHDTATAGGDGITGGVASARAINLNSDLISGEAEAPKRILRTHVDLGDTVPVVIPPYDPNSIFLPFTVDTVTKAKRGVMFFEVKPSEIDDWQIVTAVNVITIDDDTLPWPELIDPRKLYQREGRNGVTAADRTSQDGSDENALLAGITVPPPSPGPEADQGLRPIAAPEVSKAIASATARPVGPQASVRGGRAGTGGIGRSTQVRVTTTANSPPLSKAAVAKKPIAAKGASTPREIVVMETRANGGSNYSVTKRPNR